MVTLINATAALAGFALMAFAGSRRLPRTATPWQVVAGVAYLAFAVGAFVQSDDLPTWMFLGVSGGSVGILLSVVLGTGKPRPT